MSAHAAISKKSAEAIAQLAAPARKALAAPARKALPAPKVVQAESDVVTDVVTLADCLPFINQLIKDGLLVISKGDEPNYYTGLLEGRLMTNTKGKEVIMLEKNFNRRTYLPLMPVDE